MRKLAMSGMAMVVVMGGAGDALRADASGAVAVRGTSFSVADAVAYKADDGIEVAFLPAPLDRKEAAKDRTLDIFDLMRGDGRYVVLVVDADGGFSCINYSTGSGGGSACNGDYAGALTLTTRTAERIAGRFRLKTADDSADVTFDLKVESTLTPAGTPLPSGGGEPGRAVLAHFAAIEKNDFAALKATAEPEQRKMMEASEKSGEATAMFAMMRELSPRKVKITGGMIDGDTAVVEFEGVEGGKPTKGTADVERIGGTWYMTGSNTRQ